MNRVAIALAALLASASTAAAQKATVVYTNVVDGQRVGGVVRVMRVVTPAIAVPPSITTTLVPPRWTPEMGGRGYVPPVPASMAATQPRPVRPVQQPWYLNGLYMGPSPTGQWLAVSQRRPVFDVRVISPSRHHTSSSSTTTRSSRQEKRQ